MNSWMGCEVDQELPAYRETPYVREHRRPGNSGEILPGGEPGQITREEPNYEVPTEHGSGRHYAACHLHRDEGST